MIDIVATRTIFPYELEATNIVSAEHSLRVALTKIQKRNTIKPFMTAWPNLELATRKLARILTHEYPSDNSSGFDVLSAAMLKAISAYEAASITAESEIEMADAFVHALITEAAELVNYDVHGMDINAKTVRWEHLSLPLIDWAKKRHFERLVFSPRGLLRDGEEKNAAEMLIACQILTVRETARFYSRVER